MAKFSNSSFTNSTVDLDNHIYEKCKFESCKLVYSGGKPPSLINCEFSKSNFVFSGEAANTLAFMKAMYHGGFQVVIDDTIKNIKEK